MMARKSRTCFHLAENPKSRTYFPQFSELKLLKMEERDDTPFAPYDWPQPTVDEVVAALTNNERVINMMPYVRPGELGNLMLAIERRPPTGQLKEDIIKAIKERGYMDPDNIREPEPIQPSLRARIINSH